MTKSLLDVLRARLSPEQRRFIKFLVVGASGVPVNLFTVFVATLAMPAAGFTPLRDRIAPWIGVEKLTAEGVRDVVAYLLGIVVSIFTNFLLNNFWTWGDRVAGGRTGFLQRLLKFYIVSALAACVQLATSTVLSSFLRGTELFALRFYGEYCLYHIVAPLVGILLGLFINFGINNLWTFKRRT